jgi:hypothetical protein
MSCPHAPLRAGKCHDCAAAAVPRSLPGVRRRGGQRVAFADRRRLAELEHARDGRRSGKTPVRDGGGA